MTEVKRQAMLELQKAVSAVEQKANELVANERQKMDRALAEARKQAHDEVLSSINHQEDSSEVQDVKVLPTSSDSGHLTK